MGNKSKHHSAKQHAENDVLARKYWLFYLAVALALIAYSVFMGHWAIR